MGKTKKPRYVVWDLCEQLGVRPPEVKSAWSENDAYIQAAIITYSQIRDNEEA